MWKIFKRKEKAETSEEKRPKGFVLPPLDHVRYKFMVNNFSIPFYVIKLKIDGVLDWSDSEEIATFFRKHYNINTSDIEKYNLEFMKYADTTEQAKEKLKVILTFYSDIISGKFEKYEVLEDLEGTAEEFVLTEMI